MGSRQICIYIETEEGGLVHGAGTFNPSHLEVATCGDGLFVRAVWTGWTNRAATSVAVIFTATPVMAGAWFRKP